MDNQGDVEMSEFLQELNFITDISVLESMRANLAGQAHSAELTWEARNLIYKKIQAIVNRLIRLEHI